MQLEYELKGAGWAQATIHTSQRSVAMDVSYLHDSLQELAVAAILLCKGIDRAQVTFVDEPGEHRLVFKRIDGEKLNLEVLRFNDWPVSNQTPDEVLLHTQITSTDMRKKVLDILWKIEQEYGSERYLEEWINHDFPQAEYERLRAI